MPEQWPARLTANTDMTVTTVFISLSPSENQPPLPLRLPELAESVVAWPLGPRLLGHASSC